MKRLVFIVEGHTEILLVDKVISPYLNNFGIYSISCQTITTNRKLNKKGGVGSYGLFKNEIKKTLAQGNVLITTLIDFFKLPTSFPSYTSDSTKIEDIEKAIHKDFDFNKCFIPYIQRHEVESLMYSNEKGFEFVIDDESEMKEILKIINDYSNPEDINNSPETSPSKRLKKIFNYDKINDGEMIFEMVGIEDMLKKCPRFSQWINSIVYSIKIFK